MSEADRLWRETSEPRARQECFKDCSAGAHLDFEAGCVSVCASPTECQGWVPYLKPRPAGWGEGGKGHE